ncbi:initiator tRNA phosphoribosyl transferase [Phanerochaete sordida]|uniref:Initiator tRNA phosphoribosyl transferase n=1 Tax=Phanerochaete sordida TaxID=48140 RepID=A0A9P3GAA8_9APHY|nr:initiator tRNA phosphoribosyl transferase [Phanerochaete sordida]
MTSDSVNGTSEALAHLRRESLDIFNRVHSIAEDCEFVKAVREAYPELPLVPNLRCGAWYVDPEIASEEAAYFKSTDGHFNNWSFNLRRPNIHLLPFIIQHGGLLLVDSTRSGKRLPDALSKTVPIWCAVMNRAICLRHGKGSDWDTTLYTSPVAVSRQEHAHIETQLEEWATTLNNSSYDLPNLTRPLRPFWITPSTSSYPHIPPTSDRTFYPVICVSASKHIEEGLERRSKGFSYIQGSGDDHELWGQGLTPDIFWQHRARILITDRPWLPDLIQDLVASHTAGRSAARTAGPTRIARVQGRLLVGNLSDPPSPAAHSPAAGAAGISCVVIAEALPAADTDADAAPAPGAHAHTLRLRLPQGKRGQKLFLDSVLPRAVPFVDAELAQGRAVCVCCDTGKDASVGVALAALQLFFDDAGEYVQPDKRSGKAADKKSVGTRLQWIITSRPEANPSRATLKKVNEFLMTPPELRGK